LHYIYSNENTTTMITFLDAQPSPLIKWPTVIALTIWLQRYISEQKFGFSLKFRNSGHQAD
jgi:hypothetical protein